MSDDSAAIELVESTAREQGVPVHIEDPATIARVAAIFRGDAVKPRPLSLPARESRHQAAVQERRDEKKRARAAAAKAADQLERQAAKRILIDSYVAAGMGQDEAERVVSKLFPFAGGNHG